MTCCRWAALLLIALLAGRAPSAWAEPLPGLVEVAVTARVLDIARIQETAGEMTAQVELTLRWTDPALAFDPTREGTVRREYTGRASAERLAAMWHPAPVLRNLAGAPRQDEPGLLVQSGGQVTLVRTLEAAFRIPADMSAFPFDRKLLPIELASDRYDEDRVVFVERPEDGALSVAVERPRAPGWRLGDPRFSTWSFIAWNGETRALLRIEVPAIRDSAPLVVRIFVPFLVIMVSPLFVLWAPDTNYFSKGGMIFSGLLALVALSFTLENNFPGSIAMPTPVSTIVTSGFLFLIFCLLLNMTAMNPDAGWARRHPYVAAELRDLIRWAVPLGMAAVWASVVLQALA